MTIPQSNSMPGLNLNEDTDSTSSESGTSTDQQRQCKQADGAMPRPSTTLNLTEIEQVETKVLPHTDYKKVLVTGGAGFIRSHVAQFLLARGDDVVIIDGVNDLRCAHQGYQLEAPLCRLPGREASQNLPR
jgi:hypothetical protein